MCNLEETKVQKDVLNIIFKKGLPLLEINIIKQSQDYADYYVVWSWLGKTVNVSTQKTKEEFELLKRWVNERKNNC